MANTRVKWVENVTFLAESPSGHGIIMDGAPEHGGRNLGPRPMEMLLMGMGGCASFDVVGILKKQRLDLQDVSVEIQATRAETDPKIFTDIHMAFTITGTDISQAKAERAVSLSADKYCSASIMMGKAAKVTHSVTVVNPTEDTA